MAIEEFYNKDCEKIDAQCVNAYFDLSLDPSDPSTLVFDHSWGTQTLDLTPAVKDAETSTHLFLSPVDAPLYLEYDNEDGDHECIYGEDLARIIPMTKLKDVNQAASIADGYVYMYNGSSNLFDPYDLKTFVNDTNAAISAINSALNNTSTNIGGINTAITELRNAINTLTTRVANIEAAIARPAGIPTDTKIAWANINLVSDPTNSNNKSKGIFSHTTAEDWTADEYFA